ncbi:MAG: hypothetical protein EOP84_20090 [Verrucomicrobiaceae bacterium]|nr:MAG: hypothetical protein EOP84_20090 [Verrucomicrobiaceae bacterium]
MRTPKAKEWKDPKSGTIYWRVRWNDVNGKENSSVFGTLQKAEDHIKVIMAERKKHGRAAAVNSDEISGLALWRDYVAKEQTAGREVPALRDVLKGAIERLNAGSTTVPLGELLNKYEDAKERERLSHRHLTSLKSRLKRFVSYFDKDEPAGAITTDDVEKSIASMRAGGSSPQTVKGIREAAHGLYSWALKRKLVTKNPVTDAVAPKVILGEVGILTPSQLKGLLRTALSDNPRAVPALAVWAFCGVRRAEVTRLRFDDMDLERKELRVSAAIAKKAKVRYVPMPDVLLEWLGAAEAAGVAPLGKLVPGDSDQRAEGILNEWLKSARNGAGITSWPKNALRHSFTSYACAKTEDYPKVSAWIGHSGGTDLLEARYRHAVRKDLGATWFNVYPVDKPEEKKAGSGEIRNLHTA